MADTKISGLGVGTAKSSDLFVAVDTTDSSMAPTGTDKKYTRSAGAAYVVGTITLAGDVTGPVGTTAIAANAVTNAKMAPMAAHTIKGNNAGTSGNPIDLTIAQVKTDFNLGTMADQNASSVSITGGTIDGVAIGGVSPVTLIASGVTITILSTAGVVHNNASGVLSSSLIVNADVSASAAIADTKLATIATVGKVSNSATTAVSTNTVSTIVLRDGSGNFAAGTITANLSGNATTSTSSTNFSGSLSGDVTGTQSATTISSGVITNAMINASAGIVDSKIDTISSSGKVLNSATTASASNGVSTIVARDGSGNFSAGTITASGLTVPGFSTAGVIHNNASGVLSSSLILNADITNATIANAKLATMTNNTFKGNVSGSTASPSDLTVSQMQTALGISSSTALTSTQVGFGSGSNLLTGSANLTWTDTTRVLSLPNATSSEINFGTSISARKIVLYNAASNNFQYFGFGITSGELQYSVDGVVSDHVFYAGTSTTAKQEVGRITGDKFIMSASGGGIKFGNATTSYVQSTLDYYEDSTTVTMSLSGPWASPVSFPVKLTRLGRMVSMQWAGMSAGVSRTVSAIISGQSASNNIPARFGTSALAGLSKPIRILDGSTTSSLDVGAMSFSNGAGGLFITIAPAAGVPFSNAFCGVPFGEITWQFA